MYAPLIMYLCVWSLYDVCLLYVIYVWFCGVAYGWSLCNTSVVCVVCMVSFVIYVWIIMECLLFIWCLCTISVLCVVYV